MAEHQCGLDTCGHATDHECVAAGWVKLREATARAESPTAAQRRTALARALAAPVPMGRLSVAAVVRPEVPAWSARPLGVALLVALLVVLLALAGCVPAEAIDQASFEAAIAHGHALDAPGDLRAPAPDEDLARDLGAELAATEEAIAGDVASGMRPSDADEALAQLVRRVLARLDLLADAAERLGLSARRIGRAERDAWLAQHRALAGEPVPGSEAWPPLPPELAPGRP